MEDMKGKVALVTGAAQGIGLACAEAFARARAVAVLADINRPEEQARKLAESGLKAEAFACDVSDAGEVEKMVEWIAGKFGRLDAALNNAGIQTPQKPMAEEIMRRNPSAREEFVRDIPMGRLGRPGEIAEAVLWLCGPGASFVSGHALVVDGGFTIH